MGGISLDSFYIIRFFTTSEIIISTFFQNGIWVIGFFYLLNKTFENNRLKYFSKYTIWIVMAILFIHSVVMGIYDLLLGR